MPRVHWKLYILGLVLLGAAEPAFGFRCGTELIGPGDTKTEVFEACGPPTAVTPLGEAHRLQGRHQVDPGQSGPHARRAVPYYEPIRVEEWTYDRGETRLVRYLKFVNERLTRIRTGGRGG